MLPWILLALQVAALANAVVDKTRGVPPSLLEKYVPLSTGKDATWTCLDGSKQIKWSAVNDDYCDCPDGSDEPGTGACPNTRFYCRNEGHIGFFIPSSRVNDGLCERECCDGSDEQPGVCPNTCKEVGEAHRAKVEAEMKLRKTGSKIRSSYIAFAKKEKKRLEEAIANYDREVAVKQKEVDRLKDLVERTESMSLAALEHKKQSPLYQTLMRQHHALQALEKERQKHLDREKQLGDILNNLRSNYNPNYQDMAVLEAVRGWEYFAGLPHINDVKKDEPVTEDELGSDEVEEEQAEAEEEYTVEDLERDLPGLLDADYETLLIEHEKHIGAPTTESILFDVSAYIPEALLPQYEALRDSLFNWLKVLGVAHADGSDKSADTSRAKQALHDAERALNTAVKQKSEAEEDLSHLFDPEWYGREGEWKKLDGTCISKDTGDYTYEVCLFGEAKQKPNHGGSTFSLGHWRAWKEADGVEIGSPEYYSEMRYTLGTKCWNGPQRSVKVVWSCGTENEILTVQELEKCEYQFTGTTPAVCLPPDAAPEKKREEL